MGTDRHAPARRFPLHVTLSLAFTGLLLLFGSALIAFNYVESRKIALMGAEEGLEQVSAQMRASIADLYAPAQNIVDVSSKVSPPEEMSAKQWHRWLGYYSEALRLKPGIASLFVGYEDGDFLLVRYLDRHPAARRAVDAPAEAVFAVQTIERAGHGDPVEHLLFYDDDLGLIERRALAWTGFDPRQREWYREARTRPELIVSDFYRFFTTGEVGLTIARHMATGQGVVGADLALSDLSSGLAEQRLTPSARLAILDPGGDVIALSDPPHRLRESAGSAEGSVEMPHVSELGDPVYDRLATWVSAERDGNRHEFAVAGRTWMVALTTLPVREGRPILLVNLVPRDELLAGVVRVRNQSVMISVALLLVASLLVLGISRHVARSLRKLAGEAQQIRQLRLDTPLTVRSRIEEVDDLAATMAVMKSSLQQFLAISQALSAEKDFNRQLELVLDEARRVSRAEGGAVLLLGENDRQLEVAILQQPGTEAEGQPSACEPVSLEGDDDRSVARHTARSGVVVKIDDAASHHGYDLQSAQRRFGQDGSALHSMLSVPLRNQQDEVIGVLQLVNARVADGEAPGFRDEAIPYMEALSANAAVALDNRRLLKAQRDLLDSLVHMVAGAIDAKSPYTHGHCQRVPELARMLAEAAHASETGPFADFGLNEDEWYELHLASWLHDCGKMTTPEYVVDKATKLETIHNRVHEIRTRFEILWRDAELEYLHALASGETDEPRLRERLEQRREQIRDDFEFVAECNLGEAPMTEVRIERMHRIGSQSWLRHLDDRLGLSHDERQRMEAQAPAELPANELLLDDKPWHVIPRENGAGDFSNDPYGFRMEVPQHLYNRGELYNLCTPRGTLTEEERFKINEHIIQTIRMLGRLPFPRELRRIPDWAGNHHEKLDGTGYPRRLAASDLSVPDRIMAIADIFEALTATDRPYMQPKPLSRVLRIMGSMRDSGHICPELFELFLTSGVHLRYAEEFLQPQQIDTIDLDEVLGVESGVA